mmetsp:Transcript_37719/g.77481  ORF Transcript_37719/g.77481 Transcript_37719/m.77481 type:complete len:278 (+) Transcript_37719:109-942(+)|eukprot:CAMPEP_0181325248 /NCGR_PEP_ID=MMETSP1101-20121128/20816_1 /TAXON_ID=46948 /ORGANISM="Rhodomonas abbreviata, Strain Caron Lab Isolate" /LENGTH=277 /DNA_ID=CAMNT_0023433527 /DNA_START=108 /DNA_END=941 /DNA_ORIENTATION=+
MPRDHYEVLGVSRDASRSDILKAYKKLALKWHPDKNPDRAQHAEKMFKEINESYQVLTDNEKKSHYDRFGHDEPRSGMGGGQAHAFRGHPAEMDPIFQAFFGGHGGGFSFGPGVHFTRHTFNGGGRNFQRQRGEPQQQQDNTVGMLQSLFPILLLILFTFVNFPGSGDSGSAAYTLSRDPKHPVKRMTAHSNVPYYVRQGFEREVAARYGEGALEELEAKVEMELHTKLVKECQKDRGASNQAYRRAQATSDVKGMKDASMTPASCEKLHLYFADMY